MDTDDVVDALAAQQDELAGLLAGMDDAGWDAPSRCAGWSVADVVLHLAQTNELAVASCEGRFDAAFADAVAGLDPATSVEDGAGAMVAAERGAPGPEVGERWRRSAAAQVEAFRAVGPSTRVRWVAGELAARSLATTRLSESWIHTTDVAAGLGVEPVPTDRLRHVARLAWRTLPYAFAGAGKAMQGPVAFELTAPDGSMWRFGPDDPQDDAAGTVIRGDALELCLVAGQRLDASQTGLIGEGPDATDVLALVRTFA